MNVLIIGGTGLISTGIVKHLLARGAQITMYNRGKRENTLPPGIKQISGDRNEFPKFEANFTDASAPKFDVVIDMIAFTAQQAESDIRAFAGRCKHFIFCSTVCTYGVKVPPGVVVDESFPQEPISKYGKDKVSCEQLFLASHQAGKLNVTIVRPSHTYGPGGSLIDNLHFDPVTWDRIEKGLPVLCASDGMGLWNSTHRDDVGKLFAYAALNPKTYGQSYNATREQVFTWRDYYRQAAQALGKPAQMLFLPAGLILKDAGKEYGLLREITQFHGAYTSAKAMKDVPEFRCEIDFPQGAAETLKDVKRRNAWKKSDADPLYQKLIDQALSLGLEPVTA